MTVKAREVGRDPAGGADLVSQRARRRDRFEALGLLLGIFGLLLLVAATFGTGLPS